MSRAIPESALANVARVTVPDPNLARNNLTGIRTSGGAVNTLRTLALDRLHRFEVDDLLTKRSKSNFVKLQKQDDLEGAGVIGWVSGTRTRPHAGGARLDATSSSAGSNS